MNVNQKQDQIKKQLNCDQVALINDVLQRFEKAVLLKSGFPRISRLSETARLSAMIELMDVLGYEFDHKYAATNAISSIPELGVIIKDDPASTCKVPEATNALPYPRPR